TTGILERDDFLVFLLRFGEILTSVLLIWVSLVGHVPSGIHDIVTMAGAVGFTHATEVDVDRSVGLSCNINIIEVLIRYAGLLGQGSLVALALLSFPANRLQALLKRGLSAIEVGLGTLELSLF